MMRDQFTIATWLAMGALLQSLTFLLLGRLALLPAAAYLALRLASTLLAAAGWKHNSLMDGVILGKFSTAFPNSKGVYPSKPADSEIVVFLLGFRNNHPLGILAPGAKEIQDYFMQMIRDLDAGADEFGMLGMTSWRAASTRKTGNEFMQVGYFKTVEGLHAFAHSEEHMKAWRWWNKNVKRWSHMSIYHETYQVPRGNWETIYVNTHLTGLPSSRMKTEDGRWASPVVDAKSGLLKTASGRMARSDAKEHDEMVKDPYEV